MNTIHKPHIHRDMPESGIHARYGTSLSHGEEERTRQPKSVGLKKAEIASKGLPTK
jgi:hypothetical protein